MTDLNNREIFGSCVDYYDKQSENYHKEYKDETDRKPYDQGFLERFSGYFKPGVTILDIGPSSSAQQAVFLKNKGFNVTAIDLSPKNIEIASGNFPGIQFKVMNMLELDFEDETFDGINAFYSIIHIPDHELDLLFTGFRRVLKPGGKISLAVHAGDFDGIFDPQEHPVYYREFREDTLIQRLEKNGFSILYRDFREPIYDFEYQSQRIYIIAQK